MRTVHALIAAATLATALLAHAGTADAACTLPPRNAVRYWSWSNPTFFDVRCDWFPAPSCHHSGYLYKPSSTQANQPALMLVHGHDSELSQDALCNVINFYFNRGYVVWVPYLRGVADTSTTSNGNDGSDPHHAGFVNTGINQVDWLEAQDADDNDEAASNAISYLYEQMTDVQHALDFLLEQKTSSGTRLVHPGKLALMGHSYGGTLVTLAAGGQLSPQPTVIIDFSGAALSWGSSDVWRVFKQTGAMATQSPMMFLMTISESPTATYQSATVPYLAAAQTFGEAKASLYGPVPASEMTNCDPDDSVFKCAHGRFFLRFSQVQRWGYDVLDFMRFHGVQ